MSSPRRREGDLRISELVRRTGVSRATIQHYLNERLLPRPRKTGQTMAYYDESTVQRVRLIKELQRRHMPLQAIRALLEPSKGRRRLRRVAEVAQREDELETLLSPAERPLRRDEVMRELGLGAETLAELERLQFISAAGDAAAAYGPCDVAVLRAVAQLASAGLDRTRGFNARDLVIYRDAMFQLMSREVELFGRADVSPDDFVRLAQAAAVGASELVAALHRKLVVELVARRPRASKRQRKAT